MTDKNSPKYTRVLLKLSGEQLAGNGDGGINPEKTSYLAEEIKKLTDQEIQVVIMVGGGNFVRGAQITGNGIKRVTGDHMGMLATMINALALTDIFEEHGISTRCLTNIFAAQVAEPFVHRLALKHLNKGRVVIVGGGIGRPYLTTDTAAVALALEIDCDVVLKATKVDGVFDQDPEKNPNAKKFDNLDYQKAVENKDILVMDKAAMGLAMEQKMPIIVFDSAVSGNILKAALGENVGTTIS
ncbi:MAG: UMP kinase [bacterium]|nr:UMP kinase [bacterium]